MLRDDGETVELAGTELQATAKARQIDFGDVIAWVPKSVCEYQQRGTWLIAAWFAKKEGLIE